MTRDRAIPRTDRYLGQTYLSAQCPLRRYTKGGLRGREVPSDHVYYPPISSPSFPARRTIHVLPTPVLAQSDSDDRVLVPATQVVSQTCDLDSTNSLSSAVATPSPARVRYGLSERRRSKTQPQSCPTPSQLLSSYSRQTGWRRGNPSLPESSRTTASSIAWLPASGESCLKKSNNDSRMQPTEQRSNML
jgi:hypothetical protein